MSSIVLISDTHGNKAALSKLTDIIKNCDYFIHLGDIKKDVENYENVISISGNCDMYGESEKVIDIDGIKILITHGHNYSVKTSLENLKLRAEELGVKYVFYGHTHIADITTENNITFINPGTMSLSSMYGQTYCYINTYKGKILAKLVNII